jgi:hypothetical protein
MHSVYRIFQVVSRDLDEPRTFAMSQRIAAFRSFVASTAVGCLSTRQVRGCRGDVIRRARIVAGIWKVSCWTNSLRGLGNANGAFLRKSEALEFARVWLRPGWVGTLTDPSGRKFDLEWGKVLRLPEDLEE